MFKVLVCPRCLDKNGMHHLNMSIHGCIGTETLHCDTCKGYYQCTIKLVAHDPEDTKFEMCTMCADVLSNE